MRREEPLGSLKPIFLSVVLVCLESTALYAQLENGAILGTVTDQSRAAIPGANRRSGFDAPLVSHCAG